MFRIIPVPNGAVLSSDRFDWLLLLPGARHLADGLRSYVAMVAVAVMLQRMERETRT